MADLIDRAALLADIEDTVVFSGRNSRNAEIQGANKIIDRIKVAPTVDAVEVVRCKDCKYKRLTNGSIKVKSYSCNCAWSQCRGRIVEPPFFCPYGEEE